MNRIFKLELDAIQRLVELAATWLFFGYIVHLLTTEHVRTRNMVVASILLLIGLLALFIAKRFVRRDGLLLWGVLLALTAGFWIFMLFRDLRLTAWPLSHPADMAEYLWLLYSHFVLSVTALASVLWALHICGSGHAHWIAWGQWRLRLCPSFAVSVLGLSAAACWVWAVWHVASTPIATSGYAGLLALIAVIKASLTGVTEEVCYRGVILPVALRRFGVPLGIVCQAGLYALFHMHLGAAFVGHIGFLPGVFALGILFGVITRVSSGIGWVATVHTALNVVIEWNNLS